MKRGQEFLFEIHGTEGDLSLAATMRASTQRQELTVRGARGSDKGRRRADSAGEVSLGAAGCARRLAVQTSRSYTQSSARPFVIASLPTPVFDAAIARHRMLDMITPGRAHRTEAGAFKALTVQLCHDRARHAPTVIAAHYHPRDGLCFGFRHGRFFRFRHGPVLLLPSCPGSFRFRHGRA